MKIRTLYHFEYLAEDDYCFDEPNCSLYRLISRSGSISPIDQLSWALVRIDLCKGTPAKFSFQENIMLHFNPVKKCVDVCYLECNYEPNERDWEQGLESFLDQQILELYEDATRRHQPQICSLGSV